MTKTQEARERALMALAAASLDGNVFPDIQGVPMVSVDDAVNVILAFAQQPEASTPERDVPAGEVLEALKLADATLRGSNMDRAFVERKVASAIAKLSRAPIADAEPDTLELLHATLASYAGQPSAAGEAFKIVEAMLAASPAPNDMQSVERIAAYNACVWIARGYADEVNVDGVRVHNAIARSAGNEIAHRICKARDFLTTTREGPAA